MADKSWPTERNEDELSDPGHVEKTSGIWGDADLDEVEIELHPIIDEELLDDPAADDGDDDR